MRTLLQILSGVVLCLVVLVGVDAYWKIKHPLGAITNSDYELIQVSTRSGQHLFDLRKGESKFLEYGNYLITIPDSKTSFKLWKNNRGVCNVCSSNGVPILQTDGNCGLGDPG